MRLEFDKFSELNAARCIESFHPIEDWSEVDWAVACAGEVGELCNLIKKRRRGDAIDDREVEDEIADVVAYIDLLCTSLGSSLSDVVVRKFNIVSDRVGSRVRFDVSEEEVKG